MSTWVPRLRLPIMIVLALWLGYMVLASPDTITFTMSDGTSTVTVPRSLEGWSLEPGEGDTLLTGSTRLGLFHLEVETTPIPVGGNLAALIAERHTELWKQHDDYQVRLKGELKPFGHHRAPTSRAVYDDKFLWTTTRWVRHDVYWRYNWQYVRVGFRFPEFLDNYFGADQYYIANNVNLAP